MSEQKPNGGPVPLSETSKPKNVQVTREVVEVERAVNSPRTSQKTWREIKCRFECGDYLSLAQLADDYKVHPVSLRTKMHREKWNEKQRTLQNKVERVIEKGVLSEAERQTSYLLRLSKRGEKYEKILDASMENLGSKDTNGTPLLDPEAIDQYTRSESRVVELMRVSLRLPTLSSQDLTSKGMDLGSSFVQALAKLREDPNTPKLSDSDLQKVLEAEVE